MFDQPEDVILNQSPAWHGAGIAWHDNYNTQVTKLKSNHERYAGIKIKIGKTSLLLISLYAPTSGKDEDFLECFGFLSDFLERNKAADDIVIIGTDSNCSTKSTKRRKSILSDFCQTSCLKINKTEEMTFHHNNGTSESCIDYFLTSETFSLYNLYQLCTLDTPTNMSSHDPIIATISLSIDNTPDSHPTYAHTYTKFNQNKIVWSKDHAEQYQALAGTALTKALDYWIIGMTLLLYLSSPLYFPNSLCNVQR